ncbi:hypothetical protein ATCC90586_004173 [Pythium insidiosum]|nr:hypothetical protein ATCC90586_004173 [Pythium insidiosum]
MSGHAGQSSLPYRYDPAEKPFAAAPMAYPSAPPLTPDSGIQRVPSTHPGIPLYSSAPPPPMAPMAPSAPVPPRMPIPTQHSYRGPYEYRDQLAESHGDHATLRDTLIEAGQLAVFHGLNAGLGFMAFSICLAGVSSSFATLPLCCFGLVVFRLTLYAVYGFAQLDVLLFNFASPPDEHVFVQLPSHAAYSHRFRGERLSPKLSSLSPLSLMVLIYFLSIKLGVGVLSSVALSTTVAPPVSLVASFLDIEVDKAWFKYTLGPEDVANFKTDPGLFLVASVCLFLIGVALMHLVASLSKAATRFFCCEQFSTYADMDRQHFIPDSNLYPAATATIVGAMYPSIDAKLQSPSKPSANVPAAGEYDHLPMAQPVADGYVGPGPGRREPPASRFDDGFVKTLLRLSVFHFLNSMLGVAAFATVIIGTLLGIGLIPLCCFGIVVFRLTLYFVGFLAELDVSLYNYIAPPSQHVFVSIPRQGNWFEFTGLRLASNLSSFSSGALLASLYFVTIKFVISVLSYIALAVTFSIPLAALTSQDMQHSFSGFIGTIFLIVLSVFMFFLGTAFMNFAASISLSATRFFCCERFSTYQYVAQAASYPPAATYGTVAS